MSGDAASRCAGFKRRVCGGRRMGEGIVRDRRLKIGDN